MFWSSIRAVLPMVYPPQSLKQSHTVSYLRCIMCMHARVDSVQLYCAMSLEVTDMSVKQFYED